MATKIEHIIQGCGGGGWYDIQTTLEIDIKNNLRRYRKACPEQKFQAIKRTITDEIIDDS